MGSLKVGIQKKLDIVNNSPSVFVPVKATLGSYDFNKEGFNLNLSPRYSFDYRNYNWNLAFPTKVHTMISMDEGGGDRYLKRFPTRHVNVLVESSMSSAKQGTLYANPIKLHVLNPDGELLKTINL
ncbi:MAG: hypothetical protein JKY54_07115 [Flavobacteriales bacterium]|nr:hypothetical protein [Flavobacteriales bacterium]